MVDNFTVREYKKILDWSKELPSSFQYLGLIFIASRNKNGNINYYTASDDIGFRHVITPEYYQIQNSIHKAFNRLHGKEGNYNHLKYAEISWMIEYLCDNYKLNPKETLIKKIELGVNIKLKEPIDEYLERFRSIQFTKGTDNMRFSNKVYGKKIYLSQYDIKIYDKLYQHNKQYRANIQGNILRYELVFKKIEPIKNHATTISDLLVKDNYIELTYMLSMKFLELQFDSKCDLTNLSNAELGAFFSGQDILYWKELSKRKKSTFGTKKRRYKAVYTKVALAKDGGDELILELRSKIKQKIYDLV